jgi:hypothetical protein
MSAKILTSTDADSILRDAHEIRNSWDFDKLRGLSSQAEALEKRLPKLSFGGALRLNRTYVESAIERIRLCVSGSCLCEMYLKDEMYDPERESEAGRIKILKKVINKEKMQTEIDCECKACGQTFHAEDRQYHYTWWEWDKV